jgi:hypothetical protein
MASKPSGGGGFPFALGALVIWVVIVVGLATPIRELGWLCR